MHWIARAGLADRMHVLGSRADMPRLHAALDVFTLSSCDGEALPLAIAEAMACGIPCVATDVGDVPAMIGNSGLCVQPRDPQALAGAWRSILQTSDQEYDRLSAAARRRAQDEYDLSAAVRAYQDLYAGLLRG